MRILFPADILSKSEKLTFPVKIIINDTKYTFIYILFQTICIKIKGFKHYELQSGERSLQQFGAQVTTTIIEMQEQRWYLIIAARLRDRDAASRLPRDISKALLKVYHLG